MKRFHVHVSVHDLDRSIRFYSTLFGAEPTKVEADYAKWMLDDPRINFAISTRDQRKGVNHLGIQVESGEALSALEHQLRQADASMLTEANATCCYAKSDKYWVTDPQGVAWESFHTLGGAPIFGKSAATKATVCCAPPTASPASKASGCC